MKCFSCGAPTLISSEAVGWICRHCGYLNKVPKARVLTPTHTHIEGVSEPSIDSIEPKVTRDVRQKSEKKRKGKKE